MLSSIANTARLVSKYSINRLHLYHGFILPRFPLFPKQSYSLSVQSQCISPSLVTYCKTNSYLFGGVALFAPSQRLNCVFMCGLSFFPKSFSRNTVM